MNNRNINIEKAESEGEPSRLAKLAELAALAADTSNSQEFEDAYEFHPDGCYLVAGAHELLTQPKRLSCM